MKSVLGSLSSVSRSLTCAAKIWIVHCSLGWKLTSGVMTQFLGPAETTAVWEPVFAQVRSYHVPMTSTGSLKKIATLPSRGAGVLAKGSESVSVLETEGGESTIRAVRRGFGVPAVKSAPF